MLYWRSKLSELKNIKAMKSTYNYHLWTLATVLCLSGCDNRGNSSRLMIGSEDGAYENGFDSESGNEDSYSYEERIESAWESVERRHREYESDPWHQLEVAGGYHEDVPTSYAQKCVCITENLRPFQAEGFIIMCCDECDAMYLLPSTSASKVGGVQPLSLSPGDTIEENNKIQELGCKLFAAGKTGWATDEEVNAYDWERNKKAYEAYQRRNNSAGSTPTRQNSTEIVSPPAIESR